MSTTISNNSISLGNKQKLLTEYYEIPITEQIVETARNESKKLIIPAILQRAMAENQNNRVYPAEVLQRESKKYESMISENRALGELDHPDSTVVNLANVSHAIRKQWWDGSTLRGMVEILPTPHGKIARSLIAAQIKLGVSSRGVGSVEVKEANGNEIDVVQDDFNLICYDIVSNPSTHGAFLGENVQFKKELLKARLMTTNKINSIINEILK